ncbi:MAG TPA: DUF4845 domain-containing protein [Terriglobales bacterium]|nr:DUF4845 domain-containing protein [Terriglobales bacterium]
MKTLRLLVTLCVIGGALYALWQILPVYMSKYQFEEALDDAARTFTVHTNKGEAEIRQSLFEEAQELHIPIRPEDIRIERMGNEVTISADYTVHVDLPIYPLDLDFHPSSKRQALTFR